MEPHHLATTDVPPLYYPLEQGKYAWISASEYSRESPEERARNLREAPAIILHPRQSARMTNGCASTQSQIHSSTAKPDLASALRVSRESMVAEITALEGGFFFNSPATLFRAQVQETFSGRTKSEDVVFFTLSDSDFEVDGVRVCRKNPLIVRVPALGDRVLLLSDGFGGAADFLRVSGSSGLVVLPAQGGVSLPLQFEDRRLEIETQESFLTLVRGLAAVQ